MPIVFAPELTELTAEIFRAAGASARDAGIVAIALVEANLAGHDSHGALRVPEYIRWMEQGLVNVDAQLKIAAETDSFAVVDGDWGFGQVVGRDAMGLAIKKAERSGVATISARQCCHLGRIGDYPAMAAERGMATVMFVNTHGGGKLVAPFGGTERRLSANPIAIGIPRTLGAPIIVDISTCSLAEGKVRNMLQSGRQVPPGSIIDHAGVQTTDPADLYGPPEGALLPFGGHKGFALGLASDILAGALSGAGCSRPDSTRVGNSFLATVIDVDRVRGQEAFERDVEALIGYVKSSRLAPGVDRIVVPGEPEEIEREKRVREGIPISDAAWREITETGERYGVRVSSASSGGAR